MHLTASSNSLILDNLFKIYCFLQRVESIIYFQNLNIDFVMGWENHMVKLVYF